MHIAAAAGLPDPAVIAAADQLLDLACRAYAASGMSDDELADHICGSAEEPSYDAAARALVRHCVWVGLPPRRIVAVLATLAAEVPGWPADADEIAQIVRSEFAS